MKNISNIYKIYINEVYIIYFSNSESVLYFFSSFFVFSLYMLNFLVSANNMTSFGKTRTIFSKRRTKFQQDKNLDLRIF